MVLEQSRDPLQLSDVDHLKVDSGKAIAQLGYRETPLPQLMADTLAWMRAEGMVTA